MSTIPKSRGDWSWHTVSLDGYDAFADLASDGEIAAPTFNPVNTRTDHTRYDLIVPVEHDTDTPPQKQAVESVLALDGGVRKPVTAVVVTEDGEQLSPPHFIRSTVAEKLLQLKRKRDGVNNALRRLRAHGRGDTDRFDHLFEEYTQTQATLSNARDQLVRDVANQVLALAVVYDVDAIAHEDLRSISPLQGEGELSWRLSSWTRRDIIEKIEYRATLVGIGVERVWPRDTSRTCPRCGSTGHTTKSPDHIEEVWWGGHFRCDNDRCPCQGDRDYIGALNVARAFFGMRNGGDGLRDGPLLSYTGSEVTVSASRSVEARPGIRRFTVVGASSVTAGGGSTYTAPAVMPAQSGTKQRRSGESRSGPATEPTQTRLSHYAD